MIVRHGILSITALAILSGAGVGDEALTSVYDAPQAALPSFMSLGRAMPTTPMDGQKRPPCGRGEVAIYGACWVGPIGSEKPPCGETMFDYEGGCYKASVELPRKPTSEGPR